MYEGRLLKIVYIDEDRTFVQTGTCTLYSDNKIILIKSKDNLPIEINPELVQIKSLEVLQ